MDWKSLEPHPIALLVPPMSNEDYRGLVASVRRGFDPDHPLVILDGKIIDGVNRHRACMETGVEPVVVEFAGDRGDLGSWVLAKNLNRRHMNRDQKCMMAAAMIPYIREVVDADRREKIAETLKKTKSKHNLEDERRFAAHPTDSERTKKKPRAVRTAAIVAAKIGETESRMERNKKLLDHHPELAGSVWRGEMTMAQARKQPGVVKRKEKPKPPEPTERELTLSECEARIEGKLEPFLEATRALFLIRENRLYFEKYGSFDRYLNQRWGVHLRLVQEIQVSVSAPIVAAINESREKEL